MIDTALVATFKRQILNSANGGDLNDRVLDAIESDIRGTITASIRQATNELRKERADD